MSRQFARASLGISEVLAELRSEFPEISVSKIRFLEAEGLIAPARSPSGYRRFGPADIDQLRFILTAQRDQYLPLRVIKERLDNRAAVRASQDGASAAPEMISRRPPCERRRRSLYLPEQVSGRGAEGCTLARECRVDRRGTTPT